MWNNQQVVSPGWVNKSLNEQTNFSEELAALYDPYDAFAYSWWIDKDKGMIWADGYGGQFLCIDRANELVVVQRNFTGNSLLSSGLFLMDKNRDNNPKSDLIHVYDLILQGVRHAL